MSQLAEKSSRAIRIFQSHLRSPRRLQAVALRPQPLRPQRRHKKSPAKKYQGLSSEASSRRGGRRDLPTLDASELAAAAAGMTSKPEPEETLVPRVSRRRLGTDEPKVAKTQPRNERTQNHSKEVNFGCSGCRCGYQTG